MKSNYKQTKISPINILLLTVYIVVSYLPAYCQKEKEKNIFDFVNESDYFNCLKWIKDGKSIHIQDSFGQLPIYRTIGISIISSQGKEDYEIEFNKSIFDLLIENGQNSNHRDREGNTILNNFIKYFFKDSIKVGFYTDEIKYPHEKVKNICRILLNQGCNPNIKDNDSLAPLHYLSRGYYVKTVIEVSSGLFKDTIIHFVDTALIKLLLQKKADQNIRDKYGRTPLMYACEKGVFNLVKLLIENGAKINLTDTFGNTALHYSVLHNKLEFSYSITEDNIATLFYTPLISGDLQIAKYLINNGASVDIFNKEDKNALCIALERKIKPLVNLFLSKNPNSVLCQNGLLNYLSNLSNEDSWKLINQSELLKKDSLGRNILMKIFYHLNDFSIQGCDTCDIYDIYSKITQLIDYLIGIGINVQDKDIKNNRCINFLNTEDSISSLILNKYQDFFISKDITIKEKYMFKNYYTNNKILKRFINFIEESKYDSIRRYINDGFDINFKANYGYTPIMYACMYGDKKMIDTLVKYGADLYSENIFFESPLYISIVTQNFEVAKHLINKYSMNINYIHGDRKTISYKIFDRDLSPIFFGDDELLEIIVFLSNNGYIFTPSKTNRSLLLNILGKEHFDRSSKYLINHVYKKEQIQEELMYCRKNNLEYSLDYLTKILNEKNK